jgi:hypothetical protein
VSTALVIWKGIIMLVNGSDNKEWTILGIEEAIAHEFSYIWRM